MNCNAFLSFQGAKWFAANRTADPARRVYGGANAFGARGPPSLILNIPNGPLTAVLDYRAPLVVDGEPPQIVRIRPVLNAIVPRAIEVEARVLDVHSPLAQVEARLGSGVWKLILETSVDRFSRPMASGFF